MSLFLLLIAGTEKYSKAAKLIQKRTYPFPGAKKFARFYKMGQRFFINKGVTIGFALILLKPLRN
jgi:hypothetical protein